MNRFIKIVVSVSCIVWSACSSKGEAHLSDLLPDNEFTVTGLSEALVDCQGNGGEVPNASAAIVNIDPTGIPSGNVGSSGSSTSTDGTVVFSDNDYSYIENGVVIYTGTWSVVDDETLDMDVEGASFQVGVSVDGKTIEVSQITGKDCSAEGAK